MSQKLVDEIMTMTDVEDLRRVADVAKQRISNLASVNIRVGDKVQMAPEHRSRKPYDAIGTIDKVNPKKFKVNFGNMGCWNVPHSMIIKAK